MTNAQLKVHRIARTADEDLELVARTAAEHMAKGRGDDLVLISKLLVKDGRLKGISETMDGITCAAAIDVLRWLVADYEEVGVE